MELEYYVFNILQPSFKLPHIVVPEEEILNHPLPKLYRSLHKFVAYINLIEIIYIKTRFLLGRLIGEIDHDLMYRRD